MNVCWPSSTPQLLCPFTLASKSLYSRVCVYVCVCVCVCLMLLCPSTQVHISITMHMICLSCHLRRYQVELKQERLLISTESEDDFYFLAWPITVIHRIDHKSPFWGTTSHHLALAEFEILIVLEANCESTGGTLQVPAK